ncbi:MAG TPA: bifunctional glutamate N-acetyltransferase/amino-acid acetyltransferase ArgJ [Chromatiaceae bacterium]|nr:bifunctional glutamate N-acetyltransferase/amino-acid acetyltransferase ArgJ [Chromatiaceae bacterium]
MSDGADATPIAGVRLAATAAGIRYRERDDLVLMDCGERARIAVVFTRNAFCAAPVHVAREHLAIGSPRYLLINAGNANAGTGEAGMRSARDSCELAAAQLGAVASDVLPFSTGVIGEDLPLEPFEQSLPELAASLREDGWSRASRAIMTTDTVPKLVSRSADVGGATINVTGMAKGAGMICPNMATMLAFIATDAEVSAGLLQGLLEQAVAPSFNSITVDGDTSTNDACALIASGAGVAVGDDAHGEAGRVLRRLVDEVCMALASGLIRDAEGATKLVTIEVAGAASGDEARQVAYTVAHSPLVKTALFASDPNWGRILAAVGRAGVENLSIDAVEIWLGDVCIVRAGGRDPAYTEAVGRRVMARAEIPIRIRLGRGDASARVLTSDLSYDYVRINAEYRS